MGWNFNSPTSPNKVVRGAVDSVDVSKFVTGSSSTGKVPVIAILLPHMGSFSAEFVEKTWLPLKSRGLPWCEKQFYLCRVPSLPLARNILVKEALKGNADFFFFLDSDELPESPSDPNESLKQLYDALVETGESIASGLYRAKQVHGFNYAMWQKAPPELGKEGYVNIDKWTGNWIETSVIGMGAVLIRREVFERMKMPYFSWEVPDSKSEDFDAIEKMKALGYKCWVLTTNTWEHEGKIVLSTNPITPKDLETQNIPKFRVPSV